MAVGHEVGDLARRLYDSLESGVLLDAQRDGYQMVFLWRQRVLPAVNKGGPQALGYPEESGPTRSGSDSRLRRSIP